MRATTAPSARRAVLTSLPIALLVTLGLLVGTPVAAQAPITVSIDIYPGDSPNVISLKADDSVGSFPVAILGSPTFDVTRVDPASIRLAGSRAKRVPSGRTLCETEDVNGDGSPDLICQLELGQLSLKQGDSVAVLEARTRDGTPIRGEDSVQVVGGQQKVPPGKARRGAGAPPR